MKRSLMKEAPLLVHPKLAAKIGLKEAMILQQIHYWLQSKRNDHCYEGRHWIHNTYEEWKKQFPFWSHKTIQRSIESLEQKGFIDSFSSHEHKKTKFYTVNYDQLDSLSNSLKEVFKINEIKPSGQSVCSKETICPASGQTDLIEESQHTPQRQSMSDNSDSGQFVQSNRTICLPSGQSDPFNQAKMTRSYIPYTETTTETTLPPLTPPSSSKLCLRQEDEEALKIMFKVWDETVYKVLFPGKQLYLTQDRKVQMSQILQGLFDSKLEAWEDYCKTIAACSFLMGQNEKNFRVTLDWALNPKNALKVLENDFYSQPVESSPVVEQPWDEYAPLLKAELKDWPYAEEWLQVCEALVRHLGQVTFNVWFRQVRPKEITNTSVTLLVPNTFTKDYILREYISALKICATAVYPLNTSLSIEIDANIVTNTSINQ